MSELGDPSVEADALRLELWATRDELIGAIAELGTLRARIAELEAALGRARSEMSHRSAPGIKASLIDLRVALRRRAARLGL